MAVRLGGGTNHRMGLYDMILVKDNHVDYAGSMAQALENVAGYMKAEQSNVPVVVEVRDAAEAAAAMAARTKWQNPTVRRWLTGCCWTTTPGRGRCHGGTMGRNHPARGVRGYHS